MANRVQSKNIRGYMKIDGTYYQLFCGQTLDFQFSQEVLEKTNVTSGSSRVYRPGMNTASFSVTGVTVLDNTENSKVSINYLLQQVVRQQVQDWMITQTDDDGGNFVYTFQGVIQDGGFNKALPGFSKSNVNIVVNGNITMDTMLPPDPTAGEVFSDWWVFTLGATSISGTSSVHGYSLVGKEVLEVDREGTQHNEVTSGTPGNRQYKFNSGTGVVSFDPTNPSNGETVFVLFK